MEELNFDNLFEFNIKSIEKTPEFKTKVKDFCEKNQIFGGSFAILSKRYGRPFLLFAKEVKAYYNIDPEIEFYEYLNTPYDAIYDIKIYNKYFIDVLFHAFRMEGTPEYIKKLDHKGRNKFEYTFENQLRTKKKILHCSSGEILFFLITWRIIIKKILKRIDNDKILYFFNDQKISFPIESKFYEISIRATKNNNDDDYIKKAVDENLSNLHHLKQKDYLSELGITSDTILEKEFFQYLKHFNIGYSNRGGKFDENIFIKESEKFFRKNNEKNNELDLLTILHEEARFPLLPYYFLYKHDKQNRRKDHFVMPVWWVHSESTKYTYKKNSEEISVDHVLHCLYTLNPLVSNQKWYTDGPEESELSESFKKYLFNLVFFLKSFVNPIMDNEYYSKVRDLDILELKKNSLKSSLAAVMARNMSHNIGSHVLNKLSDEKNVQQFFDRHKKSGSRTEINPIDFYVKWVKGEPNIVTTQDDIYEISDFLIPSTLYCSEMVSEETKKFKGDAGNFKKYLKSHTTPVELTRVFNDYLKKRMDFVADVATANNTSIMSSKPIFSEVFKSFEKNLVLLAHISGKEEVFKYKFNFTVNGVAFKAIKISEPMAAMPNDVLGTQAFCIILENIIRNTAKHAKINWNRTDRITFTIDVNDTYCDEFLKITIYDDAISYVDEEPKDLIEKRNQSIKDHVLDANNELRAEGWGTIELKIAACYLSRLDLDKIDQLEYSPIMETSIGADWEECLVNKWRIKDGNTYYPILQAVDGKKEVRAEEDGKHNKEMESFGYSFLIKKPKELLIYDTNRIIKDKNNKPLEESIYKNLGVDFLTNISSKLTTDEIYFQDIFLVIDRNVVIDKFIKDNKSKLPNRIVYLTKKDIEKPDFKNEEADKYIEYFDDLKLLNWQEIVNKFEKPLGKYIIEFKDSDKYSNEQNLFKFEHHATDRIYLKGNKFYNASEKEINYYEPYGSSSGLNNFLESYKNKSTVQLQARMLEAICGKVAIIDERIQGVLNNTAYTAEENKTATKFENYERLDEITYLQLFQLTNIEVIPLPKDSDDKGVLLTGTLDKNSLKNIIKFIKETKAAFVVIHFGIIESLRFGKNETSIKTLEKILKGIKPQETEIIITSGRGFTKDVQALCDEKYKFINYSAFSNYVIDPHNRSKMHLIHLLKSLRI